MSCSLARAAAPPVTALSTPPRKEPRLFSPEPARAAPAQQTAIRSGEGTNVQPDRFGCWCRTAGCLIPLFTCVLNLETDQVRGGTSRKQKPPAGSGHLRPSSSFSRVSHSLPPPPPSPGEPMRACAPAEQIRRRRRRRAFREVVVGGRRRPNPTSAARLIHVTAAGPRLFGHNFARNTDCLARSVGGRGFEMGIKSHTNRRFRSSAASGRVEEGAGRRDTGDSARREKSR